jgi:phosphoribosylaminoimidazolecarboxamide formyltransferase / IMP cyclohydrolase
MGFNSVKSADDLVVQRNVLVSTYDKAGLADFVRGLAASCAAAGRPGLRFYSTGGTYEALRDALRGVSGTSLVKVSDYTGQPEMKGGLVKTLDWKIYLGLLAESGDEAHEADLERSGAVAFDMVVANLYPFAEAAARAESSPEELRQRIDIGGPSMIRAAAKNFLRVASVSSPDQYGPLLAEIKASGGRTRLETRRRLAAEAFALISRFDATVAARLGGLNPAAVAAAYGIAGNI